MSDLDFLEPDTRWKTIKHWFWHTLGFRGRWYNLRYGVENLIRWFPIIWQDRDWDQYYLLRMMEQKFRRMAWLQEKYGSGLYHMRYCRQLRIAALLCRRMMDDECYHENARKEFVDPSIAWAKEISAVEKQDKEMLGRLIGKYIDHWWD